MNSSGKAVRDRGDGFLGLLLWLRLARLSYKQMECVVNGDGI